MVVSPGPADLSLSALTCADSDGGLLLPGDDVRCAVAVRPRAGYEDVQGATAAVQIPISPNGPAAATATTPRRSFSIAVTRRCLRRGAKSAAFHLKIKDARRRARRCGPLDAERDERSAGRSDAAGDHRPTLIVGQVISCRGSTGHNDAGRRGAHARYTAIVAANTSYKLRANTMPHRSRGAGHRRRNHLWRGSHRRSVFVKSCQCRTPRSRGTSSRRPRVPKKGKWAPEARQRYDRRDAPDLHREAG